MFKWANGKIAEMVFYCHSVRVTNSLLGLTPDMIVYLAAIHAYVNNSHFDFGSFMRRLASYFKSIQLMKKSLEMDEENDDNVYYVPIEYHVPPSTQYDNLQVRVMAALEKSRIFTNVENDKAELIESEEG